jgi:hypothetical protein
MVRVGPIATRADIASYENQPASIVIVVNKTDGVWPGAPTARADTVIMWKGEEPSPPLVSERILGQPGLLLGVDIRLIV